MDKVKAVLNLELFDCFKSDELSVEDLCLGLKNEQGLSDSNQKLQISYVVRRSIDALRLEDRYASLIARVEAKLSDLENSACALLAREYFRAPETLREYLDRIAGEFGYKTANLFYLKKRLEGVPNARVPDFEGICHSDVFLHLKMALPQFESLWTQFVTQFQETGIMSSSILGLIQSGIKTAFSHFSHRTIDEMIAKEVPLMVRSTGREDGQQLSNQGGNKSMSNVLPSLPAVRGAIGEVVASYFSMHSLTQRKSVGDDITANPFVPLLIQVMAGEKEGGPILSSGVMYTQDQLKTEGVVEINATFGHAEAVVTGSLPCDQIFVRGNFVHQIGAYGKRDRLFPSKEGGLVSVGNPPEYRMRHALPAAQAKALAAIGKKLEAEYGYPLDIEWSFDPQTGIFDIFQARQIPLRPPLRVSYIDPSLYAQLEEMTAVSVLAAGAGGVIILNSKNTLNCPSVDASTIAAYEQKREKGEKIEAIVTLNPLASTSHEAGFFRQHGVSLVHAGPNFYKISKRIGTSSLLLDVQEGFIAVAKEGVSVSDLIRVGLRRHLVPKKESSPDEWLDPKDFIEELNRLRIEAKDTKEIEDRTYGRNRLDRLLNCYENATSLQLKAYFLSKILILAKSQIEGVLTRGVFAKIIYNAKELWDTSKLGVGSLEEKYALAFFRTSLIEESHESVIDSETLHTIFSEKKDKRAPLSTAVGAVLTHHEDGAYLDFFLRAQKMIINPARKKDWESFCHELSSSELQDLAHIFYKLGPTVIGYWINTVFQEALGATAHEKLSNIKEFLQTRDFQRAFAIFEAVSHQIRNLRLSLGDFSRPETFQAALENLSIKMGPFCKWVTQNLAHSKGLAGTLLTQTFLEIVDLYDTSIKALTQSSFYKDPLLKAHHFIQILELYTALARSCLYKSMLKENRFLSRNVDFFLHAFTS